MGSERIAAALRVEVSQRARECCEYCRSQARFAMQAFSVDHIEPRSRRGKTSLANLAFACQGCNNHKHKRTHGADPLTAEAVPLFHPRRNRWRDHFNWNADCTLIVGLSAIGRATVDALRLNRPGLVNLRRILFQFGAHPPAESD